MNKKPGISGKERKALIKSVPGIKCPIQGCPFLRQTRGGKGKGVANRRRPFCKTHRLSTRPKTEVVHNLPTP